jgi:glycosyltransferase involved in cell wall biosynthesis
MNTNSTNGLLVEPSEGKAFKNPTASVVMPSFNAEDTIRAAFRSIQGQTFDDLEIIVVDDGSADSTPSVLRDLATSDRRVRLVNVANAGPANARNVGFKLARGRFIALLDADDLWSCNHLERHIAALEADTKLGVSFAPCDIIDCAGRPTGEFTQATENNVSAADLLGSNPTATCSSLVVRREVIESVGPMCVSMKYAEDQEWLFRIACAGWAIRCIDERTVVYRTSNTGLSSNSANMMRGWEAFIASARLLAPEIVERHLSKATAEIHIYHARRAIRTLQPGRVARSHVAAAFFASPRTVTARPIHFAGLAVAALSPRLANTAIKILCSV